MNSSMRQAELEAIKEGLPEDERGLRRLERQREAEQRYRDNRLRELEDELRDEPKRIERIYEVRASRLAPLGVLYLWPKGG